eukprot:IDg21530t1
MVRVLAFCVRIAGVHDSAVQMELARLEAPISVICEALKWVSCAVMLASKRFLFCLRCHVKTVRECSVLGCCLVRLDTVELMDEVFYVTWVQCKE